MKSTTLNRLFSSYGMVVALFILCVFFSWRTMDVQHTEGAAAGHQAGSRIVSETGQKAGVLIVAGRNSEDIEFSEAVIAALKAERNEPVAVVNGIPSEARAAIVKALAAGRKIDSIACTHAVREWPLFEDMASKFPGIGPVRFFSPEPYRWPNFLKADNLLNIANQIAVIAIIAIGMTMVIITGGIDLSVGSLIALSAVVAALLIANQAGAEKAGATGMVLCCAAAIAACAAVGFFSGVMITAFDVPPFIVTLAMMQVGHGLSAVLSQARDINQIPDSFYWLGRGTTGGVPNPVILMLLLYVLAHIVMSKMTLGRYIYAVGGNREAARLSGVPVTSILLLVYSFCGALAGLGGVIFASRFKSGSQTYGTSYELYVIAAVVVGGTSLTGGEGKIFGTLIGAFIIAVIQNGMNLTGLSSFWQEVVLGLVILGSVLLDKLRKRTSFSAMFSGVAGRK